MFALLAFVHSASDGEVVEEWKVSCLLIAATKNNLGNATVYIRSPLTAEWYIANVDKSQNNTSRASLWLHSIQVVFLCAP